MSKYAGKIVTNQAAAGYSVFFDGTGDYLSAPSNSGNPFDFGTGNFTIEGWYYATGTGGSATNSRNLWGISQGGGASQKLACYIDGSATLAVDVNGSTALTTSVGFGNNNLPGRWAHVALVRSGTGTNQTVLYVNGVSVATGTVSTNFTAFSNPFNVGYFGEAVGNPWLGYIASFRVVKGTALYTAAFTPPTQLLNVTNTSLLTCNSPAIVDQSSNAFAITVNGNTAVSTFTPFTAYVPYNPALGASTPGVWTLDEAMQAAATRQWNMYDPYFQNTTLLLHGNGTNAAQNNTFLDSSSNNFTITRNGNTTQGSFSPFSQASGAWSNYFDGSGDYLSIADNAALDLGAGDFCVEAFVYPTGDVAYSAIAGKNSGPGDGWFLEYSATRGLIAIWETSNSVSSATAYTKNSWQHIVFCRSGSTVSLYKDGIRLATTTSTATIAFAAACTIGVAAGGGVFPGYISNARIVKGSSPYNATLSTLTVPTAPLTAITNTSLLTCQSNRFIDNSSNAFAITILGDTSVQAFSPFYPTAAYTPATIGGSGYFDGTGDYLTSATNTALQLGSSDFSIEWWEYRTAANNVDTAIVCGDGTFSAALGYYNSGAVRFYLSTTGSSWNVFSDTSAGTTASNSWNHFVLTRSGTAFRVFLNGVLGAYATGSGSVTQTTNQIFISGGVNGNSLPIEGYMSGVRFVKGSIPTTYQTSSTTTNTSIFTPPTAPVTTTSQGATSGDVKYLVNFTNAGIVDSTAKNVLETVGNAQISTTQSKFGGSSMYFDGTGDALFIPPNQKENLRFGTGDFTIEFWAWKSANGSSAYDAVISIGSDGNYNGGFAVELSSSRGFCFIYDAAVRISSNFNPNDSTWHHYAVVRNGSTFALYKDGVQLTTATLTPTLGITGNALVGAGVSSTQSNFNGYLDDLRVTKFARYTAAFTPQTSQWQDQ